jgi:hypothetical protein
MIKLGDKMPSFGLHRFSQGLRFTPIDDEGFTLRSDKHQLVYKGRRRSHRFTILGDSSFEYDCILKHEPETNIIRLRIDGAEKYDFLRQPDFVENPLLQGSYAVYKKVTLLGEGTGKLCHIHRPEIIDARGRRCWGSLAVVGDELLITIPEKWLGEAKYPVVVDPILGTSSIGSQNYYKVGGSVTLLSCMYQIIMNKIFISENIASLINFFVYKATDISGKRIMTPFPCMFNNVNDLPNTKISYNERSLNDPNPQYQAGWMYSQFDISCPFSGGDYIWLGVSGNNIVLRFDYGGILEKVDINSFLNYNPKSVLPNVLGDSYSPFITTNDIKDFRVSMYLQYVAGGNDYKKIISYSLNPIDSKNIKSEYNRKCSETSRVSTVISKAQTYVRKCVNTASSFIMINGLRFVENFYSVIETVLTDTRLFIKIEYNRKFTENIKVITVFSKAIAFFRHCINNAKVLSVMSKTQAFFRQCIITAGNSMWLNGVRTVEYINSVIDTVLTDTRLFIKIEYNRKCTQAMKVVTAISKTEAFFRKSIEAVRINDKLSKAQTFLRKGVEITRVKDIISRTQKLFRKEVETAKTKDKLSKAQIFSRKGIENVKIKDKLSRAITFLRKGFETIKINDTLSKAQTFVRKGIGIAMVNDTLSRTQKLFRKEIETAKTNDTLSKAITFLRKGIEITKVNDTLFRAITFLRKGIDSTRIDDSLSKKQTFSRKGIDSIKIDDTLSKKQTFSRKGIDSTKIDDTLSKKQTFLRKGIDSTRIDDSLSKKQTFLRKGIETIKLEDTLSKIINYLRKSIEIAKVNDKLFKAISFLRKSIDTVKIDDSLSKKQTFLRKGIETARLDDTLSRKQTFLRKGIESIKLEDTLSKAITFLRKGIEIARVNDTISRVQTIMRKIIERTKTNMTLNVLLIPPMVRFIFDRVRPKTKVSPSKGIYRKVTDALNAKGFVIRKLFISLKLMINSNVRSYLIKRFLNAKIEITIKSRIGETNRNEELGMRN